MYPDIDYAIDISWGYSSKDATGVFQIRGVDALNYLKNANGWALWGSALYATRSQLGGSLSTARPSASVSQSFVANGDF